MIYNITGRLISVAENYCYKCIGVAYNEENNALYKGQDIFQNANNKSKETIRREIISQINIFQASNQDYKNKYNLNLMHKISNEIIEDLNFWKSKINKQKDIELYNAIIVIFKNMQVNTNTLSDKNIQDQKIGKSAERWAIIGTNTSVETQNRIENI